jgi:hypothetical protein
MEAPWRAQRRCVPGTQGGRPWAFVCSIWLATPVTAGVHASGFYSPPGRSRVPLSFAEPDMGMPDKLLSLGLPRPCHRSNRSATEAEDRGCPVRWPLRHGMVSFSLVYSANYPLSKENVRQKSSNLYTLLSANFFPAITRKTIDNSLPGWLLVRPSDQTCSRAVTQVRLGWPRPQPQPQP